MTPSPKFTPPRVACGDPEHGGGGGEVFARFVGASPYAMLCRPFGACIEGVPFIRRVSPYADLCRPFGAFPFVIKINE